MSHTGYSRTRATGIALVLAFCSSVALLSSQDEAEALKRRSRAFFEALSAKNAASIGSFFADDAVLQTADMPAMRSRQAIAQFYAKVFGFLVSSSATPEIVRVASSGDMAFEEGRAKNVFSRGQTKSEFAGKYLIVWVKQNGDWVIAAYALSSDQAGK